MEKVRYMISDAATMAGVESHVLRYWEDELDLTIPRNEMGHRYYTRENILEFQRIKSLKEQGYQLKAIRTILHNGGDVPPPLVTVMKPAGSEQAAPMAKTDDSLTAGSAADSSDSVTSSTTAYGAKATDQPAMVHADKATGKQTAAHTDKAAGGQTAAPSDMTSDGLAAAKMTGGQAASHTGKATEGQATKAASGQTMRTAGGQAAAPAVRTVSQTAPAAQPTPLPVLSAEDRMEQFRELMSDIVGRAISQNNEELSLNISQEVHDTVLKEMNYLFREQEDAEEERFKKLDAAIRGSLRRKRSLFAREDKPKKEKPPKQKHSAKQSV